MDTPDNSPPVASNAGLGGELDKTLLLDVLETTKLFVQSHPHDRHYMARILKALGMLAPDRYPAAQVAQWVPNLTA